MLRQLLQSLLSVVVLCQIGLAQDQPRVRVAERTESVVRDRGKETESSRPVVTLGTAPTVTMSQPRPSGHQTVQTTQQRRKAAAPTTAPNVELDILIACVVFDEKGELRLKKEATEPEVNRAGTLASNLVTMLNEKRNSLPSEATPGVAGANFLLEGLVGEEKLESLEQFTLRLTGDGSEARIQDANRMPRIVGSTVSQRGMSNTVELENVGVIIVGSAQITKAERIAVTIELERSAFGPPEEGTAISVQGDTTIRTPRIDVMTVETGVALLDGESTVLKSAVRSWGDKVTETFVVATASVVKR